LYRLTNGVLANIIFSADPFHRAALPQIFQGYLQLVFNCQSGRLFSLPMQYIEILFEAVDFILSNVLEFTPYSRLNNTGLASCACFPPPHTLFISF
jgi:hypothetical protein